MKKLFILILMAVILVCFFNIISISALSVAVHVPEKYTDVVAGERLYFETQVKYPENPTRKDLRLNYEILEDSEVIAQSKVLKAIETQASFIDFIVIPESASAGLHVVKVGISDYEELSEEVETSFQVKSRETGQIIIYFFILLGAIIIVGILVLINIFADKKIRSN